MSDNRWKRKENPYNQDNLLYKRLTRLLSGPIVNLQRQSPRYYRADQYVLPNKLFKSTSGQAFKKQEYDKFYNIQATSLGAARRSERYMDFDQMEFTPEINSALDIYADEMTTSNDFNKLLKINCNNEEIKEILTILFYKILNIEFNLFGWSRTMCKYGDTFLYLDIEEGIGVKNVFALPVSEIERLEGEDKTNPNYIQFQWNAGGMTLENWQVAHFRILGNDKYVPYGTSVLEPSRRIWRQLCVAAGEQVLTPTGPVSIEHIKEGDEVYCWNPDTKETARTQVVAQKYMGKQDVFSVKTNHRNVKVTDKHGLMVYDGHEYLYKQAKEISVGKDYLVLPTTNEDSEKFTIKMDSSNYFVSLNKPATYSSNGVMEKIRECNCEYSDKNIHAFLLGMKRIPHEDYQKLKQEFSFSDDSVVIWRKDSDKKALVNNNLEFTANKEMAKLFGFLLGDGWLGQNRVGFATGIDSRQNEFYKDLLEKFSNSISNEIPAKQGIRGGQINVFSIEFKEILEELGFITGSLNKQVPNWIYGMSKEIRREFIRGYFDADGGDKDGRVTSVSLKLLEGIQELAYSCGIPCNEIKVDREDRIDENNIHHNKSYRLYLNMNKDNWHDFYQIEKVLSYCFEKEDDTYDIQVEDELHNFIVSGIVSHNTLLEDAMMAYRIVRSPERRVFKIDVGGIAPEDIQQFMEKTVTEMKRHKIVDDQTGRVDLRFNPMSIDEDFFIPVRPGSATSIENLAGGQFTGAIDDVEYLRDKLFSALKLPRSYLARGKDAPEDKTTLSQKDTRFAKTIQRLQRSVISELEKVAIIHLYTMGYKGNDLVSFNLSLNNPSKLSELQELEHWKSKFEVASAATEGFFSKHWIAQNIFGITDDQFVRNIEEMFTDAKVAKEIASIAEGGGEEMGGAGGGGGDLGGLGGDLGGMGAGPELGGEPEAGGEAEGGEPPAPEPAAGGENILLAAPEAGAPADKDTEDFDNVAYVRYRDGSYQTPGSKGKKYFPVNVDKRKSAGRRKNMLSQTGANLASDPTGMRAHKSFAKGIMENLETNYFDEQEEILHQTSYNIKMLLESLESKKDK